MGGTGSPRRGWRMTLVHAKPWQVGAVMQALGGNVWKAKRVDSSQSKWDVFKKMRRRGTSGRGLAGMAVLGQQLDVVILEVFPNLSGSTN